MITTIYGDMDEAALEKREGVDENDNERVAWVEYWKDGELVHRSVHLTLKTALFATGVTAELGG